MGWTTPRTWTTSELVTAALLNTHLRDNLNYLYGGKKSIFIPATAWQPATTSGAEFSIVEISAGYPELAAYAFDKDTDEYILCDLLLPLNWNLGTITYKIAWTCASASTNGVAWALQGVAVGDGEQLSGAAFGSPVVVTDDAQNAAYDHLIAEESDPVTISGSPAAGDLVALRLLRDVSDADDDLAEDALLLGVHIFYTIDQAYEA